MVRDELLSFRQQFWPSNYPIEARYYVYAAREPWWTFTWQQMRTPEELRAFQQELAKREQTHEWSFLAYYESSLQPLMRDDQVGLPVVDGCV